MATIKGKWVFNANLSTPTFTDVLVNFVSNENSYTAISYGFDGDYDRDVIKYNSTVVFYYDSYANDWNDDAYRTVDFGTTEQTVSDTFLAWITANATPEAEPIPTDKVSVLYKGELIGTIEQNNEGIIGCTGETMEDDIIIRVPAMGAGATVYSIDWDTSDLSTVAGLDILFLPTSICAGQTVAGVIFAGNIKVNASNCDIHKETRTIPSYYEGYSGELNVIEVSNPTGDINIEVPNPTGDINIVVEQSHGGGSN